MTQSGEPLDNAIAERVNGIMKDPITESGTTPLMKYTSIQILIPRDYGRIITSLTKTKPTN